MEADSIDVEANLKMKISTWKMTVSIREMIVSIWEILSPCPEEGHEVLLTHAADLRAAGVLLHVHDVVGAQPHPPCSAACSNWKQSLKAVHHIVASSTETRGAFDTGFDSVNLHHSTTAAASSP